MECSTTDSVCNIESSETREPTLLPNGKQRLSAVKHFSEREFASRFRVKDKIGSGGFGSIYKAYDLQEHKEVAIKVENRSGKCYLDREVGFYRTIQQNASCGAPKMSPRCHMFSTRGVSKFAVFDLMGSSLADLFYKCRRKLSLKCVLMLAERLVTILEEIHRLGFVHGDVKPGNFVMGTGVDINRVYVIDFGLSNFWRDKQGAHIPLNSDRNFKGTYRYASINSHLNIELSRRDDLEALAYVLIYFLKGSLPWQNLKLSANKRRKQVGTFKAKISIDVLTDGIPYEFKCFLLYAKGLEFAEEPNYAHCRNLFRMCFERHAYVFDYVYDWLDQKENNHVYSGKRRVRAEANDGTTKFAKLASTARSHPPSSCQCVVDSKYCSPEIRVVSPSLTTSPHLPSCQCVEPRFYSSIRMVFPSSSLAERCPNNNHLRSTRDNNNALLYDSTSSGGDQSALAPITTTTTVTETTAIVKEQSSSLPNATTLVTFSEQRPPVCPFTASSSFSFTKHAPTTTASFPHGYRPQFSAQLLYSLSSPRPFGRSPAISKPLEPSPITAIYPLFLRSPLPAIVPRLRTAMPPPTSKGGGGSSNDKQHFPTAVVGFCLPSNADNRTRSLQPQILAKPYGRRMVHLPTSRVLTTDRDQL